ncbi:MAG TPA: hypothetical protein PLN20_04825 [Thermotogota bacterium]|jgi:hypothetical protein|nr:hypothetical protein [Thermotogota bacterium]NLH18833.1 hypothetical protein [Thermotogaceae bacterium]OQC31522.1 MAG: hypothetical protein BWX67_01048 [Thermotogota bacterium ADurb.Bin062]HNW46492.1 hypothetical protein [Thermotogota bacterium]HNY81996.1 hypothetical protein [Thermotogota bacterium]
MRNRFLWLFLLLSLTCFSVSILDFEAQSAFTVYVPGESLGLADVNLFYFDRPTLEQNPEWFGKNLREDAIGAILLLSQKYGAGSDTRPVSFLYDITPVEGVEKDTGYPLAAYLRFFTRGEEFGGESDCGDCGKPLAQGEKTLFLADFVKPLGLEGLWIELFNDRIDPYQQHTFTVDWFVNDQRIQKVVDVDPNQTSVSVCFWDPKLIMQIAQAFYEVICSEIVGPLSLRVSPVDSLERSILVSVDGVKLNSDVRNQPEELLAFNRQFLLGQKLLVSFPDFIDQEDLKKYLAGAEPVPVLVWKSEPISGLPQVLWNIVLISNGFASIDGNNLILAPFLRICKCQ